MSGRLLRKVLKEHEAALINADPTHEQAESEPDSPAAAAKNPFDLLDDADADDDQVSAPLQN